MKKSDFDHDDKGSIHLLVCLCCVTFRFFAIFSRRFKNKNLSYVSKDLLRRKAILIVMIRVQFLG